jgi:formylglycine-generating enzyme
VRSGAHLVLVAALAGCSGEAEPRPEWIVTVSTDAPLPQLGDRLLIETLTNDGQLACADCRRVLSAASADDFPVSFSVVPNGQRLLLRTRLYRSTSVGTDGLPDSSFLIDRVAFLPETSTRRKVAMELPLTCFGVAVDWSARQACAAGSAKLAPFAELAEPEGAPLEPGTAPLATQRDCVGSAPSGMRCIPGGLFVLGDERLLRISPDTDPRPERLVRLSPFFLDEEELTVGAVRALVQAGEIGAEPTWRGETGDRTSTCTYLGDDADENDAAPITCVSRELAQEACQALGKRLPSEAEWEYAAGNATRETMFPWGSDLNVCQYAVLARVAASVRFVIERTGADNTCLGEASAGALTGPIVAGHPLDVTELGIRNLAGNVAELVADRLSPYTAPCWQAAGVLENPVCDQAADDTFAYALRGGAWGSLPLSAPAAARSGEGAGVARDPQVGFRCARSAE